MTVKPVDKTTYLLLAFLLGGIGIHKFYCGKTAFGILYIVFCWTYIPGILAFIEAICACTAEKDEYGYLYVNEGFFDFPFVEGVQIGNTPMKNTKTFAQKDQAYDEILKWKELYDCGAITEEEYTQKKKELLNR